MFANRLPIVIEYVVIIGTIIMAAFAAAFYCSNIYYDIAIESKKSDIQGKVQDAVNIINHFQNLEKSGAISRDQAQSNAITIIKAFHHDQDDYLWLNTYDGTMLLHPNAGLIGKHLYDMTDSRGNFLFHKFREMVEGEGSGFVRYYWPKPSFAEPIEKISYVNGFSPWKWVVGAGLYIDDVNDARIAYLIRSLAIMSLVGFVLISIITIRYVSLRKEMKSIESTINDLAKGKFSVHINDAVHANNPFYAIWHGIASVGKYLGSLERKYLDHETEKENERREFEIRVFTLLTDCENNVVSTWEKVRASLAEVRHCSDALCGQIDDIYNRSYEFMKKLDGETKHISDARTYLEKCREMMANCSENIEEVILLNDKIDDIAKLSLGFASKFSKAADDDLLQSVSLFKSVSGHIRLIDLMLTDHVIVDSNCDNQNNYLSISAETKCILQRMDETIDHFVEKRTAYMLDFPAFSNLQFTGLPILESWQREIPLSNMEATEQTICTLEEEMNAAIETVAGFGEFSRDAAKITAKQNAELVKVSWKLSDVSASMDEIIRNIEITLSSVRDHMRKPV